MEWLRAFSPFEWFKYLNENPRFYLASCLINAIIFHFINDTNPFLIATLASLTLWLFTKIPMIFAVSLVKDKKVNKSEVISNLNLIFGNQELYWTEGLILHLLSKKNIQVFSREDLKKLMSLWADDQIKKDKFNNKIHEFKSSVHGSGMYGMDFIQDAINNLYDRKMVKFANTNLASDLYAINDTAWKELRRSVLQEEIRNRG